MCGCVSIASLKPLDQAAALAEGLTGLVGEEVAFCSTSFQLTRNCCDAW